MRFTSLIWPLLDAKRLRRMTYIDPIVRLDFWLELLDE
jgi:hypothetical protein